MEHYKEYKCNCISIEEVDDGYAAYMRVYKKDDEEGNPVYESRIIALLPKLALSVATKKDSCYKIREDITGHRQTLLFEKEKER